MTESIRTIRKWNVRPRMPISLVMTHELSNSVPSGIPLVDLSWRPLFHILTVNFSKINRALQYVPFIFYLILISFTSFGWVLISGEHMPKWMDLGKIPGWPASPRPAGLAPPHTVPHLQSRGNVTRSSTSESRIGCWFNRMDWKAYMRIKGPTI